ncbi:MAG: hypothetical protein RL662_404 [Bacteroidota bacterium]|jgi:putative NADPH-quinone reductase
MKTVVIFSHPNLDASVANKTIIDILKQSGSDIEVRYLDALYPNYNIDVEAEQNALLTADVVVFQHPLYWYSTPPIFKLWIDKVLTYGFAYGETGDKLKGKKLIHSFTTGGPAEAYAPSGYNNFTLEQLVLPIRQTANLVQLDYVKMLSSSGIMALGTSENVVKQSTDHAHQLLAAIKELA